MFSKERGPGGAAEAEEKLTQKTETALDSGDRCLTVAKA